MYGALRTRANNSTHLAGVTTAANRERVLAEWTKRYNSKTEKR